MREPASSSRGRGLSMPVLKLARGVSVLFCPTLALADRAFPSGPSLIVVRAGGVDNANGELTFECGYAATAVISGCEVGGFGGGSRFEDASSRTTARPIEAIPKPAPDAQS